MTSFQLADLEAIVGHLGIALNQVAPSDDQIIVGHIRDAHEIALRIYRDAYRSTRERMLEAQFRVEGVKGKGTVE